ncbi:MAG: tetratricopeptide repeat protein, partial [Verrucomicrobiota bacterium]
MLVVVLMASCRVFFAEVSAARFDVMALQPLMTNGLAARAADQLAAVLEKDPDNARLLYDHGVAAYAAGRFDEALLSFDRAESLGD